MGADHSRPDVLFDDDYDVGSPGGEIRSPSFAPAAQTPSKAAPATRLYLCAKVEGNLIFKLVEKGVKWKFTQDRPSTANDDEDEDDDDYRPDDQDEDEDEAWYLVVPGKVSEIVTDNMHMKFGNRRIDFVAGGRIWAVKFASDVEYQDFVKQFNDCLFENVHGLTATDANRAKALGKDYVKWATGEDGDGAMWEDASDVLPPGEGEPLSPTTKQSLSETLEETPRGKKPLGFAMGATANSYLLHEGGIDVYKNRDDGVHHVDGLTIALDKMNLGGGVGGGGGIGARNTPSKACKALLMHGESTMLLMSPAAAKTNESPMRSRGVRQLDIEAQKVVAEWRFEKDGSEISMLDVTGDSKSAQLDTRSTFLGLDDNRLCRWDMREKGGRVQTLATSMESPATLTWADGHQFSRGTNFQCFATTGDGCVAVGSRDGRVRLYSTTTMRQAKSAFPGLGSPITHIDVTFDGRWVLATTDKYLILISASFRDKEGKERSAFLAKGGASLASPRLLKLTPEHALAAGKDYKFQSASFSWVTEGNRQERNIVAHIKEYSIVWSFRRVKQTEHECYQQQVARLKECMCYRVLPRAESVIDSKFMHDNFTGPSLPEAPLVVATPHEVASLRF